MSKIGLSNFHYAVITSDDSTGVVYEAMKKIEGLISASVNPASNSATLYADNAPAETATTLGEVTLTIETKDIPIEDLGVLLGHDVDKGVMIHKSEDIAPYVGVAFESLKANGKKRFVKVLKGRFNEPEDGFETLKDSVNFQTTSITGTFVVRNFDKAWKKIADEDGTGYESTTGDKWYDTMEPSEA